MDYVNAKEKNWGEKSDVSQDVVLKGYKCLHKLADYVGQGNRMQRGVMVTGTAAVAGFFPLQRD